jgi:HAD superfamily hydrolase (TIGR01549 family)
MTETSLPKLWLFDFDNTLARLEPVVDWPALRAEVRAILERAHAPREIIEQVPPRSLSMYDAYRAHIERARAAAGARVLERISKLIEKYELAGVARAQPLDGAIDLLRAVAALNLACAIVTSNSSVTVARWLERHRARDSSQSIIGRDSRLALKPSPAMLKRALQIAGLGARDAVFVGDSDADLIAARAARVRFIGIATDQAMSDRLVAAGATEIYSSPGAAAIHLNLIIPDRICGRQRVDHREYRTGRRIQSKA